MEPNDLQLKNARQIFDAFAPPMTEFHYGTPPVKFLYPYGWDMGVNVRMTINEFVFVVAPDGRCMLEYPSGGYIVDPLDSDGPDYNPEAVLEAGDLARKRAKEQG